MSGPELFEILLRAMNAGAALLIAGALFSVRPRAWRTGLGALFVLGAASYTLASAPALVALFGPWFVPLQLMSIFAGIFFWWFALSMFNDDFRWRAWHFIPFAMTAPLAVAHYALPWTPSIAWTLILSVAHAAMIFGYVHAVYIALRFAPDDLVEGRRRLRFFLAIAVSAMGLMVVGAEISGYGVFEQPPRAIMLLQAGSILALTLGFGWTMIAARADALGGAPAPAAAPAPDSPMDPMSQKLEPGDRPAYARLMGVMAEGAWREEGLSVAALAARVGAPEHHLRRIINGALGYRNFSAFLNSYRVDAAKAALADPEQARRQVLQVALDVGYGSIAPFNRAFKDATGTTPSDFRRHALGGD